MLNRDRYVLLPARFEAWYAIRTPKPLNGCNAPLPVGGGGQLPAGPRNRGALVSNYSQAGARAYERFRVARTGEHRSAPCTAARAIAVDAAPCLPECRAL